MVSHMSDREHFPTALQPDHPEKKKMGGPVVSPASCRLSLLQRLPVVSLTVRLNEETTVWSRPPRSNGPAAVTVVSIDQLT